MANGPVQLALVVASNSTDPGQPPELMTVPDSFYPLLGRIIINWGQLEQETLILTAALLSANGTAVSNPMPREFSRRWALLLAQWALFTSGDHELAAEMAEINSDMNKGKFLRDCIAHKRIAPGLSDKGNFLRFENKNRGFPWTKAFYEADLAMASLSISKATG